MKFFADAHRVDRSFDVGEDVYLKLQPFCQNYVTLRKNLKLTSKYYGPFTILEKIGKVAYRLQLPPGSKIHDVFHVSLLKKQLKSSIQPISQLPIPDQHGIISTYPELVLDSKETMVDGQIVHEILIQWHGIPSQQATWENLDTVRAKFPSFNPWGQ